MKNRTISRVVGTAAVVVALVSGGAVAASAAPASTGTDTARPKVVTDGFRLAAPTDATTDTARPKGFRL